MALIKCKSCGKEISDKAMECVYCKSNIKAFRQGGDCLGYNPCRTYNMPTYGARFSAKFIKYNQKSIFILR